MKISVESSFWVLLARGTFELAQSLVYSVNSLMYPESVTVSWDAQTVILCVHLDALENGI